ncbi:hypothetical protein [Flavitalea sp.]|nr:hypothetical protein [Flavitalea sp.]
MVPYLASKFGVEAFTEGLRDELSDYGIEIFAEKLQVRSIPYFDSFGKPGVIQTRPDGVRLLIFKFYFSFMKNDMNNLGYAFLSNG